MTNKIYTYVIILTILSTCCLSKLPELSPNNFDGSLYFVQVY